MFLDLIISLASRLRCLHRLLPLALLLPTVAAQTVTGQWDFRQADLRATIGANLQYVGDTSNLTTFQVLTMNGKPAKVMGFGANTASEGYYLRHGAQPNGGGKFVNQYTLIMDVMYPPASSDHWRALLQTDPFNEPGNDADFYVGDSHTLPVSDGIGAGTQFDGPLAPNTWYRIAFAVDLTAPAGHQLNKYVNGVNVASQSLPGGIDGAYALGPTALLFTSGLAGSFTQPGFVNSIQFLNGCLLPAAIAGLGGPVASGLGQANVAMQASIVNATASSITLAWAGQNGPFQVETTTNLSHFQWQNVGAVTTNHSITLPHDVAPSLYRVKVVPSLTPSFFAPANTATMLPSGATIHSAGQSYTVGGRPVDLAFSPDHSKVFVKGSVSFIVMNAANWSQIQQVPYPADGASYHGIAVTPDGSHVYVTGARYQIYDFTASTNGVWSCARTILMPDNSDPCGIALSADGSTAYVCLGKLNTLGVVNLASGLLAWQINVGVAPWDVSLSPDGTTAYVSDWGGRHPVAGDLSAYSAGTLVVVDNRGIGASGALSIVDLTQNLELAEVPTGLHPSDVEVSPDGKTCYVANANSDTVTVIDTSTKSVRETILARPDPTYPFGSESDGLALSKDGLDLFVADAGNNGIAVVELPNATHTNSVVTGFLPTDWYPGAVIADSTNVYVANVKGLGSVPSNLFNFLGTVNRIPIVSGETLAKFTAQVQENGLRLQIQQTRAPAQAGAAPVPVPLHVGEPSVFQHIVYVIKENKTYDIYFGDLPQGNGNSNLCLFPQFVTPNHHALATQFALLDNYYCNGVLSADGHSWCVEANVTDHVEKSFGGWARSYTLGTDALTYSSSGFIWNNALSHGLTFRNYGELNLSYPATNATWSQIYSNYTSGRLTPWSHAFGVAAMTPYDSPNVPGWNLGIPDACRAQGFIQELHASQSNGVWANFHVLYLPDDHTSGVNPGFPTPRAQVADNDLALGQVVEAVSKSSFWSNTCIFVIEDDPQLCPDHVDGHRSICLVISPYTKRAQTVSTFYTQAGMVHTMEQIMGLPPMNQQDAIGPLMFDCFTTNADFTPYTALPSNLALNEMNPGTTGSLNREQRYWANRSLRQNLAKPDMVNENTFNRIIWHSVKGNVRYPSEWAGPHGKGLKQLGLALDKSYKDDDD